MPSHKPWLSHLPKPPSYWVHDNCTSGEDGLVVEDIDLVLSKCECSTGYVIEIFKLMIFRRHSNLCNGDYEGEFIEADLKYGPSRLFRNYAQLKTFGMRDKALRRGTTRYKGFYEIWSDKESWDLSTMFKINNVNLDKNGLKRFLEGELGIPSYDFEQGMEDWKKQKYGR